MPYRKGAIGAMIDLYELALNELKVVLESTSEELFLKSDESKEDDFKSIITIIVHIVRSGYAYSNYVRTSFGKQKFEVDIKINSIEQALFEIDKMFQYKLETFENKWLTTDDEMMNTIIKTSWTTYDLEAIIEHSIVHILRHRLQIQKIIQNIN
jgi:uncharacterized damage-inducible protein DinB